MDFNKLSPTETTCEGDTLIRHSSWFVHHDRLHSYPITGRSEGHQRSKPCPNCGNNFYYSSYKGLECTVCNHTW